MSFKEARWSQSSSNLNKSLFSKENIYIFKLKFKYFPISLYRAFFLKRFIKFRNDYDHPTFLKLHVECWLLLTRLAINSIHFLFDKMIDLFNKLIVVIFVNRYRA